MRKILCLVMVCTLAMLVGCGVKTADESVVEEVEITEVIEDIEMDEPIEGTSDEPSSEPSSEASNEPLTEIEVEEEIVAVG